MKTDLHIRDARIWILRRGDHLTLGEIAEAFGLSVETVRFRVQLMDARITRGWTVGLGRERDPAWLRRLRAAGALTRGTFPRVRAYDAFESTKPKREKMPSWCGNEKHGHQPHMNNGNCYPKPKTVKKTVVKKAED